KLIKKNIQGVKTVLGVSNVSFGLTPPARQVLNLVYLHFAFKYGLDFAIYNIDHYQDIKKLPKIEFELAKNLLFNESPKALIEFVNYFTGKVEQPVKKIEKENLGQPIEKLLQEAIINRKNEGITGLLDEALSKYTAIEIINRLLLPAMKIVGDKMDSGEIILPFVLESADVMKKAVKYLERYLGKTDSIYKGTVILATVFGDVHDIGKNLVKTILANNGYKVIDLGKQVPADTIIETAIKEKATAVALSALLVSTSRQMQMVVEKLADAGQKIPVLIGGAAINENFAETISKVHGKPYAGKVFYSKDAFNALKILEQILND
ncbi:MAG: B12-binding domain-containing protein, partial [Candidatus Margulisbacteria bacterium]|nr:B12-binding domain-containing protein [Candidatus Margulisiibacteriota bacterium]